MESHDDADDFEQVLLGSVSWQQGDNTCNRHCFQHHCDHIWLAMKHVALRLAAAKLRLTCTTTPDATMTVTISNAPRIAPKKPYSRRRPKDIQSRYQSGLRLGLASSLRPPYPFLDCL